MNIIMKARVGSHLYGLNTEDSDEDFLGVFIRPTSEVLGFFPVRETYASKNPDTTLHELKKFMLLAANGNPTVLEILYASEYKILEYGGRLLLENRAFFLSNKVRNSYGGYAYQQACKLQKRENDGLEGFSSKVKGRRDKHARHTFRLLRQGKELLETGKLNPVVDNPEEYFEISKMPTDKLIAKFEEEYKKFKEVRSVLPDVPYWDKLNQILLHLRGIN